MKAFTGPVNWLWITLFAAIFTILGLFLLSQTVLAHVNPYEQIAVLNFKKLGAAIDEACLLRTGAVETDIYLPQNVPVASDASSYGPMFRIRNDGDPLYVIYYEMFPPGEAVAWEVYHDFGFRSILMLPDGYNGQESINSYITTRENELIQTYAYREDSPADISVLVANVILPINFDLTNGVRTEDGIGEFRNDEYFEFSEHWTLSAENKTFLKYIACGDNALCMKTTSGIYIYELKHCQGIKYVEMDSISQNRGHINIASPCQSSERIEVEYLPNCVCREVEYPLYEYIDGMLSRTGTHTACLNRMGDEVEGKDGSINIPEGRVPCVKVKFVENPNFPLFSREDYKRGFCFLWKDSAWSSISELWTDNPVERLTNYIYDKSAFVLEPPEKPDGIDLGEWLISKFGLSNEWRWPLEKGGYYT